MASTWIFIGLYRPSKSAIAASPDDLLREERRGSIIVGVTAGAALGTIYGLMLGPQVGAVAGVGATISVALTVSMLGVFNLARVWLAMFRKMPMDVMGFLREAYDRGVLRRIGGAYQFRHEFLQERLAQEASARGAPIGRRPSTSAQSGSSVGESVRLRSPGVRLSEPSRRRSGATERQYTSKPCSVTLLGTQGCVMDRRHSQATAGHGQ